MAIIFKEKIFRKKAPVTLVRNSKHLRDFYKKYSKKAEKLALEGKTKRLEKEVSSYGYGQRVKREPTSYTYIGKDSLIDQENTLLKPGNLKESNPYISKSKLKKWKKNWLDFQKRL